MMIPFWFLFRDRRCKDCDDGLLDFWGICDNYDCPSYKKDEEDL